MPKRISPKVQRATEEYLASLGSSRKELTQEQWVILAKHVRRQRVEKFSMVLLVVVGLLKVWLTWWALQLGNVTIFSAVPKNVERIIFVSDAGEQVTTVPELLKLDMKLVALAYCYAGVSFVLAVFLLTGGLIFLPLDRRATKKMLEALVPRRPEGERASPTSPEASG
jgi:hypothetical protein